jgi:tetratricopeptide (TPR) repeat protein
VTARVTTPAAVLCAFAIAAACAGERGEQPVADDSRSVTETPEANGRNLPVLGEELMLALAQARNYHHKADVHVRQAQLDEAIAALRAIDAIPFPADAPEAEDVKLDARARMGKLLITRGELDAAMAVVEAGIAGASRESFFVANLYTVKGEVYEAMANVLDGPGGDPDAADPNAAGQKARAREARRNAIIAFDRAISINTELQQTLLEERAR